MEGFSFGILGYVFRVLYLNRVSFLPLLTLHFWCDP